MARGLDVFKLTASEFLTQNEIDAAISVKPGIFNAQQQVRVTWQPTAAVAKAYLDQLTRSRAIAADRAAAVKTAIERAERVRNAKDRNAAAAVEQLKALTGQLETDAAAATGRDAARLRALAGTLTERAAALQ